MSVRDVNIDVNCSRSCNSWCPRIMKIFCCCQGKTDEKQAEKANKVAIERVKELQDLNNNNISMGDLTVSDFTVLNTSDESNS